MYFPTTSIAIIIINFHTIWILNVNGAETQRTIYIPGVNINGSSPFRINCTVKSIAQNDKQVEKMGFSKRIMLGEIYMPRTLLPILMKNHLMIYCFGMCSDDTNECTTQLVVVNTTHHKIIKDNANITMEVNSGNDDATECYAPKDLTMGMKIPDITFSDYNKKTAVLRCEADVYLPLPESSIFIRQVPLTVFCILGMLVLLVLCAVAVPLVARQRTRQNQ